MPKAQVLEGPAVVEKRLVSVSLPLEGVSPEALLHLGEGGPRGFWAREGRWFAHIGDAARITLAAGKARADRFSEVWKEARTIFSCSWKDPQSEVNPPAPRLFGGFSFWENHLAEGVWEHFPSADFILPQVELVGGDEAGVLTLRRLHTPSANPAQCRQELRDRLTSIRDSLVSYTPDPSLGDLWIPATRFETDPERWKAMVESALSRIAEGVLSKAVVARVLTASFEGSMDPVDVVMKLWRDNPKAHVFLFEPTPGSVLLGATPETVATASGGTFRATAVAGSIALGRDPDEQAALARRLRKSDKDLREHEVCVEDMVTRLAKVSKDIRAEEEPHVLALSAIQHLETRISAQLHPNETVLSALKALHPTPAVCGFPREAAVEFLQSEEPFRRGWYAGPVGWFDSDGNGVFVPALRSAVSCGKEWWLFAGGGIVAGSDPSNEWAETRMKFQPVLKALSASGVSRNPGEEEVEDP